MENAPWAFVVFRSEAGQPGTTNAAADAQAFKDARGDMDHKADIHRVKLVDEHRVRVRITHQDLTPRGNKGASVFIDTDRRRRGPEFVFYAGIFRGSDYVLMRAKRWSGTGRPLDCSHDLDLKYAKDVSHFTIGQGCLDRPDRVRVAVKVTAERGRSGDFVSDWLHGRRDFTRWVHRR